MDFVDLDRCFAPIHRDQELTLGIGRGWGRKAAGWLDWPELLQRRRVVLLAEALSGKSEEFRYRQRSLADAGKSSFFVSIEQLADHGLDAALSAADARALVTWKASAEPGYYFLDSVDEARLNRKSFDAALRRLARELDGHLDRAHILISCRVSDWRGRHDRDAILTCLPISRPSDPSGPPAPEPDRALLDPIFEKREKRQEPEDKSNVDDLLVVQLVSLDTEQRRALAQASGINDTDGFMTAIDRHGLETLAERPGDLIDLIEYWRTHARFDSLTVMTEHGISRKLAEADRYRPDNDVLSAESVRQDAERMAAALTLGQTSSIKAPGQDVDPTLSVGAADADQVLPERTEGQRNALLRKPCFAPSTYGRIRFHHRTTQEYLTARWLNRLLKAGCPMDEVRSLFFAERHGIETVIPSMRATAAWLAPQHPDFMDEIIRREPLVLIQNGDPGSLPLPAKRKLLAVYAGRHAAGEIANDHMDHRAIWMFAEPDLADAIRSAWVANTRQDFRQDLLRMVQEARISACADLARHALADQSSEDYMRIAALAALEACADRDALTAAAAALVANPSGYSPRLAANFSRILFPGNLSVSQLVGIIQNGRHAKTDALEGFPLVLKQLYRATQGRTAREELLAGLAELALKPPLVQDYVRVSRDFAPIARNLGALTRMALEELPAERPATTGLIRSLMVVERADQQGSREEGSALSSLVRNNALVRRELFWADVEDVRAAQTRPYLPTHVRHIHFGGHRLWELGERDLAWLRDDLGQRTHRDDRRIALSAIVQILVTSSCLDAELPALRAAIAGEPLLEADLAAYLTPPPVDPQETEYQHQRAQRDAEAARRKDRDKESWRQFRREICAIPTRLTDRSRITSNDAIPDFMNLNRWLRGQSGHDETKRAAQHWQQLAAGFSQDVADNFRDGMMQLWRVIEPARPQRSEGGGVTTKWANIFAFAGICIEAAYRPNWLEKLTPAEAATAVKHACYCEEGYPDWLEPLLTRHTTAVVPVMIDALRAEWRADGEHSSHLLHHYGYTQNSIPVQLHAPLLDMIVASDAPKNRTAELGLRILLRIDIGAATRRLAEAITARLDQINVSDEHRISLGIATLFLVDAEAANARLRGWIASAPQDQQRQRAEFALARLFGRDHSLISGVLAALSTPLLSDLARFTYVRVSPQDDVFHEGSYTPNTRDEAENARNALIQALLDRPGEESFLAVRQLADAGIAGIPGTRFRELAHGKAERECELPPWRPGEVARFERRHLAPIRLADDLLRVVLDVLANIQHDLVHADASTRLLLVQADTEEQVQHWLYEQLGLRANGRFHVHREPEAAEKNEPDIVISAVGAPIELAIEVKHGGKESWTITRLEASLTQQLMGNYLRTEARRRGVLVVSHHGDRTWRDPQTNAVVTFYGVIQRLQDLAQSISSNATGPVKVHAVGIDATKTK